ncbi:MAG: UDP-N-acetylmuramoyl-L-alanine--D-glutamate ligase [Gammaproteobacteria bacterium]|nr:UDP-N-acetylmuramoyl-L-alanine--D-glutamate ligase [Gammaproteobacteria bacterium]
MAICAVKKMVAENNSGKSYILVVGLGVTGVSVVEFLIARGKKVIAVDSREDLPVKNELEKRLQGLIIKTGVIDEDLYINAEQIIVSPGVPVSKSEIRKAVAQGVEVAGDVELFAREVSAPVIAITGSNGKSTVTTLVGEMARKAGISVGVGGNLGVPVLELLKQDAELYVLELSSFQLETLYSLQPVAATVLNISPDHMDRYNDINDYAMTKQRIYKQAKNIVVNRDDNYVKKMVDAEKNVTGFTVSVPGINDFGLRDIDNKTWLCKGDQKIIAESDLRIGGRHNTSNALAALALGEVAGLPMIAMIEALREFGGLPHRSQWVAGKDDIDWYNDSKGTNAGATLAAINGLTSKNKLVLIAGGLAKDADFTILKEAVKNKVRCVVLIGRDAGKIEHDLDNVVPVYHASSMENAVNVAADQAESGDAVLLSPACASFDMFNNYEHRGEVFVRAVEKLL